MGYASLHGYQKMINHYMKTNYPNIQPVAPSGAPYRPGSVSPCRNLDRR